MRCEIQTIAVCHRVGLFYAWYSEYLAFKTCSILFNTITRVTLCNYRYPTMHLRLYIQFVQTTFTLHELYLSSSIHT